MKLYDKLVVNPGHPATLANQLKQQITWLIATGKLNLGDQLPPIREMAERLGINLHTVRSAYHKLEDDGLVETRRGKGTHVLSFDPGRLTQIAASQRSHTIGVIIPSWTNPFYHAFLQGVEEIAEQEHTLILLSNAHDDPHTAWRNFAMFTAKDVDGILIVSHDLSDYLDLSTLDSGIFHGAPFVTVDAPQSKGYSVNIDLGSVGYQAARHLLEHGHGLIGLITFDPQASNVQPIVDGFVQALREAGKTLDSVYTSVVPDYSLAAGSESAEKLLNLTRPPTAIFAISDMLTLGAMRAIKQKGLCVPRDIALVSFNDIPTAALVEPALTTIATPAIKMGREAMKMLKVLIDGKQPAQPQIILPVELVIRKSCGEHN